MSELGRCWQAPRLFAADLRTVTYLRTTKANESYAGVIFAAASGYQFLW